MRSNTPSTPAKARILVVDDELGPRESLRMIFKDEYDLVLTECAEEGIEKVKGGGFDLILLDLKMKKMGGIMALEIIKEIDPSVPVVILTGYGTLETAQRAIRLGASDYVSKPFDVAELTSTVSSILGKRREEIEKGRTLEKLKSLNGALDEEVGSLKKILSSQKLYSSFSHEVITPMTSVLGYVQILLLEIEQKSGFDEKDRENAQKYLRIIENEVNRCRSLFRSISRIAKGDGGKEKVLPLATVIGETLLLLKPQLAERTIRTEENLSADVSGIPVVNTQLKQVFLNLCINSIYAMGQGATLSISAQRKPGGLIEIVVADTGCGMDEVTLSKATQPFFTTKPPDIGSGLGLFISKSIVENSGGSIELESTKGVGSRVTIVLPSSALTQPMPA